jgi:hypothetical protein
MTTTKELKPCDMPKEIWAKRMPDGSVIDAHGDAPFDAVRYVRADQSPPMPDEVREAYNELHSKLDEIACLGNAHGIHGNSHGNVLAKQALKMLESLRAALTAPPPVPQDTLSEVREALIEIAESKYNEYHDGAYVSEHDSGYKIGITDGHRYCAAIARKALATLDRVIEGKE